MKEVGIVVLVVVLVVALVYGMMQLNYAASKSNCGRFSAISGLPTEMRGGDCWVRANPDLWVRWSDLHYYLDKVRVPDEE